MNTRIPTGWVVGGGEMGDLIRARDWSATPLGSLEAWPQSLRVAVGMLLPSRAQICLFWGRDFIVLYNDAYRPVFGGKHPRALGLPGREAWSEIWDDQLGPLLQGVRETGEAYWASDLLFCLQRHGYIEETYFDISYDPVRDERGAVAGVYCIVTETTGRVTGERRLAALSLLGRIGMHVRSVRQVFDQTAGALAASPEDIAFALLYDWDADRGIAHLQSSAGIERGHPACASEIASGVASPWPLRADIPAEGLVLDADSLPFGERLPGGRWPEACTRIVVMPIAMPSQPPDGFLVIGASPRRPLDAAYRDFLELIAAGIGGALANAKALEAECRRATALAELDRAKTAFFSNISHEFRTPLTLLLGPLHDELGSDALPASARDNLQVAYRNGVRLLKLVNTLLDFSRIEAGRMQARFEPVDLAAFTAELASNFQSACAKAGLELTVRCEAMPAQAFVDRDLWEKIVLNLVSNALKFTFEGGIEVALSCREGRAVLAVRDTGVGIAPEHMPRLFERFHRVEGVRARTHEGSGIGLAMVQELARMHGGEVRAESVPGKGSVFELSIPLGCAHLPAEQVSRTPLDAKGTEEARMFVQEVMGWLRTAPQGSRTEVAPAARNEPRGRILVADDNADMREYIERLLRDHWDVVTVADGDAAMHALLTARFDLLLTDVMMPGMDGFRLLQAIRSEEALRDLPVVMLSARAGEEARIEGRAAGADDYLVKPFSARELVAQVRAHLAMARARRAVTRERALLLSSERAARMDAQRRWEDLEKMFNQAPSPIVILHGRDFVIELANPAACAVWGRTLGDVLHKPLFEALPEFRGQGFEQILDRVFSGGEPVTGHEVPVRLDRGSGLETVYFDYVYAPLRTASGRVDGVAVTATDVTETVRLRGELLEAR